jgi:hypothetical protein
LMNWIAPHAAYHKLKLQVATEVVTKSVNGPPNRTMRHSPDSSKGLLKAGNPIGAM